MTNRIERIITTLPLLIGIPLMAEVPGFSTHVQPYLEKYCVSCHGAEKQKGKFRVDTLTADFSVRENAAAWIEVRDRINLGEMPPEDEAQPPGEFSAGMSRWISASLREMEKASLGAGGRVVLRRMNRHEYTHTISDLLEMKFPSGESPLDFLPPDGTAEGFDKVSAALLLDPSLMEQYYRVARRIADRAIVEGQPEYPTEKMRLEFEEIAESGAISYLVTRLGMTPVDGGLRLLEGSTRSFAMLQYPGRRDHNVAPVNGFYRFTIRAHGKPGNDGTVPRIHVKHAHPDATMQKIMEVDVTATQDNPQDYTVVIPRDTLGKEISVRLVNETKLYMGQRPGEHFMQANSALGKEGKFAETIRLGGRKIAEGWGGDRSTPDPDKLDISQFPQVFLDYLEVEGPLYDDWPPKSHKKLLFKGEGAEENMEYAKEIFLRFLPLAWRRLVHPSEAEPILKVIQTELGNGESFHSAIRVGLATALTSPKFLYLNEPATNPEPLRQLTDFEIATRLSYFLWSSMPDMALFQAANNKALHNPANLRAQVTRMLADPKAKRFTDGFVRQWLRTDTFLLFTPDKYIYKDYQPDLGEDAVREPLEFFQEIMDKKLSALNFLDSDFLMVNNRLAKHYGIPGVEGEHFRRVSLPDDSPRGGILGMMGVHLAGADGNRTKPVSRAVYVREVLFNDPPDPPPPNAGEVEPNIQGEKLTVRDRLLQHQQIETCANCHKALDPYGLAMENFNVIGAWRNQQDGENFRGTRTPPILASGKLPNGKEFSNFAEYRALLLEQSGRFRRGIAEKMFVFALGRPLEPSDQSTLEKAVAHMQANGDTFQALLEAIILSQQFLQK